jgi:hypothetical protein
MRTILLSVVSLASLSLATAACGGDDGGGEDGLTCAEYCGDGHSAMFTKVVVHPDRPSFDKWHYENSHFTPDKGKG